MKKPQEKERSKPAPGQKKFSLGLKVPTIHSPHLELVPGVSGQTGQTSHTDPGEQTAGQTGQTGSPSVTAPTSHTGQPSPTARTGQTRQRTQTTQPGQTSQTPTEPASPIAPVRDYHKYANSITRDAVSANVFGSGKAKQLYDVLYLKTRGAVVPTPAIRISKTKLMRDAAIGSRNTFDTCVARLESAGLLQVTVIIGESEGNEFRVFTPEEIGMTGQTGHTGLPTPTGQTTQGGVTSSPQKLPRVVTPETAQTRAGLNVDSTGSSGDVQTLFKDFLKPDDEKAIFDALKKFSEAGKAVTGRELTRADWQAFGAIIDTLIDETTIAAARTNVSTYGKFAAENLRRRLYQNRNARRPEPKLFDPGKFEEGREADVEPIVPEPLGDRREQVLESMRTFAKNHGKEFIETFRSNHTEEDWNWLIENLDQ